MHVKPPLLIEIFTVSLGLHLVARDEAKGRRVDAVAQTAAVGRTVRENVAQMAVGVYRPDLRPDHAVCTVPHLVHVCRNDRLGEAGQPVPESNLSVEANSGSPDTMST
jgi:hypothetical protein